ncbi:MAG: hypothetical protein ACF8NJ_01095 [Phycisphaerales bacterium JB038]
MNANPINAVTLLLAACLTLVGCAATPGAADPQASANRAPAWILDPHADHPPVRYITAVGSGLTLDEAERDAHDKLGRRFRVMLDSSETHRDAYQATSGSTHLDADWERSTSLLSTVRLSTNEQLLNAQILERYQDEAGRFFARGALERLPTAQLYAEQMRINADLADSHLRAAESAGGDQKIKRLAHLKAAERAARNYYGLAHIHDVLTGMGGRGLLPGSAGPDLGAIQSAYSELQHNITVSLTWKREPPVGVRTEVMRVLNDLGLAVRRNGNGDLRLELDYTVSLRSVRQYNLVRADWRLTVGVLDGQNQQIGTISYAESDGGSDQSAARLEAEKQAARILADRLPGDFIRALYNETAQ